MIDEETLTGLVHKFIADPDNFNIDIPSGRNSELDKANPAIVIDN